MAENHNQADGQGTLLGPPRGSLLKNFGPAFGIAGSVWGALAYLGDKPGGTYQVLEQFGPRWVFFILLVYFLWDLLKRALHLLSRAVDNQETLATNMGKVAIGIESVASNTDRSQEDNRRSQEEMHRMMTFSVQTAQRSVEIASENNQLLKEYLGKVGSR